MLYRNCAGGLVFWGDKVFLMKNEKDEWVFPKGVIRKGDLQHETAIRRVKEEADISAEIISAAGNTNYEFFSVTRKTHVCNRITWYIMKAENGFYKIIEHEKCKEGGYYDFDKAMEMVTHSQDKALLSLSYKKYKDCMAIETV